ncbi:MAG: hypothetical protein Q8P65_00420 [bacterium]|nr:hypothetical protein [bacterium]
MIEGFNRKAIYTSDLVLFQIHGGESIDYPFYKENILPILIDLTISTLRSTHTQFWRSHTSLEEAVIPIYGAINVFVMNENGRAKKKELVSEFEFDPERQDISAVYGDSNGNITLRLADRQTGKHKKLRILYKNGFLIKPLEKYTIQNYSDKGKNAVFLTIRKANPNDFKDDPELFDRDKRSY